ncbi:MAG: DNA-directed RNA polymerase subunit alpha C-terminal domain-containing protein [Planctomycetota bacterium]
MATDATAPEETVSLAPEFDLLGLENPSFAALQAGRPAVFHSRDTHRGFVRMIGELPTDGEQGRRRGLGLWILGRHAEAVEALAKFEGDDVADFTRGRSLLALGRPQDAEPIFARLATSYPDEPRPRGGLIESQLDAAMKGKDPLDDPSAGIELLQKALSEAGEDFVASADGQYLSGRLAEYERRFENAVEHHLAAFELDPTLRNNLVRGAYLAERCGHDEHAIEMYERGLQLRLLDRHEIMNLGVLYEDHGRDQDAAALYDVLANNDPTDQRVRLYLSDAVSGMDMYYDEDLERKEDKLNQILRIPITDFELSVRARNCLNKMQIHTLGDLVTKTEQELLSYKNFGETSLNEIKEILRSKALRLGMPRDEAVASIEARARRATGTAAPAAEVTGGGSADRPIADLQLSIRARRTVESLGCLTVGDIIKHSADELLGMPNFGSTSLQELRSKLTDLGLKLAGE